MNRVGKLIITATAVCGTLDLISAFVFSAVDGVGPVRVMASVASGPFGDGMRAAGLGAVAAGTLVHFTIMAAMVTCFVLAARAMPILRQHWLLAGAAYGLALYLIMYWIVLPLRWPQIHPRLGWWPVGNALFSHIVTVGIPMAWLTRNALGKGHRGGLTA